MSPPKDRRPGSSGGDAGDVAGGQRKVFAKFEIGRPSDARAGQPSDTHSSEASAGPEPAAAARSFIDNITGDPRSVAGRSAQDIADQFTAAGFRATVEQSRKKGTSGNAVQVRIERHPQITNIQVHPGGGRHTPEGSPYWKISTNTEGKIWVVPGDFRGGEELTGKVVRYDE